MTRVFVQRGSASNANNTRANSSSSSQSQAQSDNLEVQENDDLDMGRLEIDKSNDLDEKIENLEPDIANLTVKNDAEEQKDELVKSDGVGSVASGGGSNSNPPPPPAPPPKPKRLSSLGGLRIGSTRRWPVVSTGSPPRGSCENDGYNSADEQIPCYGSGYDDAVSSSRFSHYKEVNNSQNNTERERQFEIDIRRTKGYEVKRMMEDGNCLFRAVADQVYGDSEAYDLARQMCIDYMERERDHFSQFITEGFTSYCKRKRRDKVYGNNVEIQALSEMYNRPIHIYSYTTEPINIFHGSYNTDTPPIRLSYHHGNHYNSLVDPRRLTIGAGLGFSSLQGTNVDKDQVKAAIKAQQDQQIDNALLAEARFCSDVELTEKEIERMVMEASRAEYIANDKFKHQLGRRESSTSEAEPSSSGGRPSGSESKGEEGSVLCSSMQMVLSMGFSYVQAMEAYSIFGDDVDSMVCYLLETSSRRKGKATE
nr:OTU domain-containing protein 5-B-like isoform X1 [Tanacetum cinerariifolium]